VIKNMLMLHHINDKEEGAPHKCFEPGPPVTLLRYWVSHMIFTPPPPSQTVTFLNSWALPMEREVLYGRPLNGLTGFCDGKDFKPVKSSKNKQGRETCGNYFITCSLHYIYIAKETFLYNHHQDGWTLRE